MLEIVIVICFEKEAWLLVIGSGGTKASRRFRAEARNCVGKSSPCTGNRSQGLVLGTGESYNFHQHQGMYEFPEDFSRL